MPVHKTTQSGKKKIAEDSKNAGTEQNIEEEDDEKDKYSLEHRPQWA